MLAGVNQLRQRRLKRAKVPSTVAQVSTSTSSAATTVLMTSNNTTTVSNQGTGNSVHISTGTTVCSTVHQEEASSIEASFSELTLMINFTYYVTTAIEKCVRICKQTISGTGGCY